jgi:serine/threonine protein kinase
MSEMNGYMAQAWQGGVTSLAVELGIMQDRMLPSVDGSNWPRYACLEEKYHAMEQIGSGVYGTVFKARDVRDGRIVAIKKLKMEDEGQVGIPSHVIREVALLRGFQHPNIVEFIELIFTGAMDFSLVFAYEEQDLHRVLKAYRKEDKKMSMEMVRKYTSELLSGLHACHIRLILHRDLKPQNLLIGRDGLKIGDFGLSRMFSLPLQNYTLEVITLWYRSPEILLGAQRYGTEVDIWSAGCIIAEMATGFPMFPGDSEIGTIFKQFQILGTPTEEAWPGLSTLEHWRPTWPKWPPTDFQKVLEARPEIGQEGIDLLRGLLKLHPPARTSCRRAKNSSFLQDDPYKQ